MTETALLVVVGLSQLLFGFWLGFVWWNPRYHPFRLLAPTRGLDSFNPPPPIPSSDIAKDYDG